MDDRPYEDRFDGEYFDSFLAQQDRDVIRQLRTANRATVRALTLERLTASPDWRDHIFAVAQELIHTDDDKRIWASVVEGDRVPADGSGQVARPLVTARDDRSRQLYSVDSTSGR